MLNSLMYFAKSVMLFVLVSGYQNVYAAREPLNFALSERNFSNKPLLVCVDSNFWYPYTFAHKQKPVGIHLEVVAKALSSLDIKAKYKLENLTTCLSQAKEGEVDAILSISYNSDRDEYMHYPYDAALRPISDFRISQVSYYPITALRAKDGHINATTFRGDAAKLPQPIRLEKGYSVKNLFKTLGMQVIEGDTSVTNLHDLLRDKSGTVITTYQTAILLRRQHDFKGKIKVHQKAVYSKSYFLAFSSPAKISSRIRNKVWREIAKARADRGFIDKLRKRYDIANDWNL